MGWSKAAGGSEGEKKEKRNTILASKKETLRKIRQTEKKKPTGKHYKKSALVPIAVSKEGI